MLQRIQTLYFVAVAVLSTVTLLASPAGFYSQADAVQYEISIRGIYEISSLGKELVSNNVWCLTAIAALIPVLALVALFLYKKRVLQIRLTFINLVLSAGYYAVLFIYLWQIGKSLNTEWYLNITSAFPLVCIVLNLMAIRATAKDEALVKSLNRLR